MSIHMHAGRVVYVGGDKGATNFFNRIDTCMNIPEWNSYFLLILHHHEGHWK